MYDGIVIPNGCPKSEIIIRTSTSPTSPSPSSHFSSPTKSFNTHVPTSETTTLPRLLTTINARWSDTLLPSQSNIKAINVIPRALAASSSSPNCSLTVYPNPPCPPTITITRYTTSTHTVTVTPVAAVAPAQSVLVGNHTRTIPFLHTHHTRISAAKNCTSGNATATAGFETSPSTSHSTDRPSNPAASLTGTLARATQGAINASTPKDILTTSTTSVPPPLSTAIGPGANKSEVGRAPAMLSVEIVVGFVGFVGVVGGVRWLVGA